MHVVRHGHKKERFKPSFAKHTKTEGDQTCEEDEEQVIKENSLNKKIEEAKEHHLDEDAPDIT